MFMSGTSLILQPPSAPAPLRRGLYRNVSASQIKLADMCLRKWWFQYVAQVKEKRKAHFVLGELLHSVGEKLLLGKASKEEDLYPPNWASMVLPEEADWVKRVVRKAIETGVWQLLSNAYVEMPVLFLTPKHLVDARGLPLMARPNVFEDEGGTRRHDVPTHLLDGRPLPADWNETDPFVGFIDILQLGPAAGIGDHKTSKNRKYATTPGKLKEDAQVLSYAAMPLALQPEQSAVRMWHNVFLKSEDQKQVYKVEVPATLERVLEQWEHNRQLLAAMHSVRTHFPKVTADRTGTALPKHERAYHWARVRGALEEGRSRDACDAFGGCPYRDVCTNRCNVVNVVKQLDAPPPPGLVEAEDGTRGRKVFGLATAPQPFTSQFGLAPLPGAAPKPSPPPPPPPVAPVPSTEFTMFAAPKLVDGYVLDPTNPQKQYRVHLADQQPNPSQLDVMLWPDPAVEPVWASLGHMYRISVPTAGVLAVPSAVATITGYDAELASHNVPADQRAWQPAPPQGPLASATGAKAIERSAPDGRFGLVGAGGVTTPTMPPTSAAANAAIVPATAPAGQQQALPAPQDAAPPPTPAGFVPAVPGSILRVAKSEGNGFWAKLKGKLAKVTFVAPGEQVGTFLYTVEIDGDPYPDVDSQRFEPIPAAVPQPTGTTPPEIARQLLGQQVKITRYTDATKSKTGDLALVLEQVTEQGIVFLGGAISVTWDMLVAIGPLVEGGVPGHQEPKGAGKVLGNLEADTAKAKEKTEKQKAKEAKEAAKQKALAGPDPHEALETVIKTMEAFLIAGKVTKKGVEGLLPHLKRALEYQQALQNGAMGMIPMSVAAPAAPQGDNGRAALIANISEHVGQGITHLQQLLNELAKG